MPRKKKLSYGEAKNRTKRLVQISIRAEEYTYQNQKIPTAEAQAYLAELRIYNESSALDVRSRQVVEKLTRLMTEIIQDDQENAVSGIEHASFTQMTNVYIPPFKFPNPVPKAILLESEKTQIRCQSPKQGVVVQPFENGMDTIDLCGDDDETAIDPLNSDISVVTAISNLSIQDMNYPQPMLTQLNEPEECSQSILSHFDDNTCAQVVEAQQLKNNNEATNENCNRPLIVLKRKNLTPVKVRLVNNLGPLLKSFANEVAGKSLLKTVKSLNFDMPKQGKETKVSDITPVINEAPKVFADPKQNQKRQPKVKNLVGKETKVKKSPRPKATPKCKNIACLNDHDYYKPIVKRPRTSKPAKTAQPKACVENKQENIVQNNSKQNNSIECRKHIVEDLSWVENLKYVRITETDEYCTCEGYEEIFWRNLDYPPDWEDMLSGF